MNKKQKRAGLCREAFEPSFLRYAEKTPIYVGEMRAQNSQFWQIDGHNSPFSV